jgi:formylmethanofuran dehydrogenase subunit E
MESLDNLLRAAEIAHGHLCAGQVLGVRMAMLGCRLPGVEDPRGLVKLPTDMSCVRAGT